MIATAEIGELILNAIALEVVMNVDEMTFAALMPATVCTVMQKVEPLAIPRLKRETLQLVSFSRVVAFFVTLTIIYVTSLGPMVTNMRLSKDNLCSGGSRPYVVAFRRESGMMKVGQVTIAEDSVRSYALASVLYGAGCSPEGGCPSQLLPAQAAMQEPFYGTWGTYTIREALNQESTLIEDMMITCLDYIRYRPILSLAVLRDDHGNNAIEQCEDVQPECGMTHRHLARFYCPETCGCEDPSSGLFVAAGCPSSCSQMVRSRLAATPCEDDRSFATGQGSAERLRAYVRNFFFDLTWAVSGVEGGVGGWVPSESELQAQVQRLGCSFFAQPVSITQYSAAGSVVWTYSVDFCDPMNQQMVGRRTVRALCPVTCGCLHQMSLAFGNLNNSRDDTWIADGCPQRCGD